MPLNVWQLSAVSRFYNLRVGTKGQIRTAPSAVTWVNSLMELAKTGDKDSQATIAAWNGQAAKADRVVGNQFMTVKNLLDMNAECRSMLFAYISERGMSSCLAHICFRFVRRSLMFKRCSFSCVTETRPTTKIF